MDRRTDLTLVWTRTRRLYHNGFLGLLNYWFDVLGKIPSCLEGILPRTFNPEFSKPRNPLWYNCPVWVEGFCMVLDRRTDLTLVWTHTRWLYYNGFLGLLNSGFKVLGKIPSCKCWHSWSYLHKNCLDVEFCVILMYCACWAPIQGRDSTFS